MISYLIRSLDRWPVLWFSLAILVRASWVSPTLVINAILLVIGIVLVRKTASMASLVFVDSYFRHRAITHFVRRSDRFGLREWSLDNPTFLEGVSPQLAEFLAYTAVRIAAWKSQGSISADLEPVQIFTAELKGCNFPPSLKSYPGFLGPSMIVLYYSPDECQRKPYARFLLYHELGHLGLNSVVYRFTGISDTLIMASILLASLTKGSSYHAALAFSAFLLIDFFRSSKRRRELDADNYAAERLFQVSGLEALDHVIERFTQRRENVHSDLARRAVRGWLRFRTYLMALQLDDRTFNLKLQRESLESNGVIFPRWDIVRVIPYAGLVFCAFKVVKLSLWFLPGALFVSIVLLFFYVFCLGFFLGSIDRMKFVVWDRPDPIKHFDQVLGQNSKRNQEQTSEPKPG
jgi:hypothetical protein